MIGTTRSSRYSARSSCALDSSQRVSRRHAELGKGGATITCLPIFHALSAIMAMKSSVALVIASRPSLEMFLTDGSSRTVLRTRASGRMRLVASPGADELAALTNGEEDVRMCVFEVLQ